MSTAKAVIQELRQMTDGRYFATHRSSLQTAAETLERVSDELAEWRATFPGKTAAEVALTFAAADWAIRANGKLMIENARLREQRPLTKEEVHWIHDAWLEFKASIPKDEIACIKCGFMVSRPVEGKVRSNCQTCGASYGKEAFL
jgi:hypothetical protein